jgi:branched-chain amino acid transport system substrate-binding protein
MLAGTRLFGLLTTGALILAPLAARAQACEDLVLGAAVSATGIYAANGENVRHGYDFAVKKVNDAGGIKVGGTCYKFKVIYYDDESTPARAAQLVDRLINQDKVKYVLGPYGTPLTMAILPVIEKYRIPLIQAEGAARELFSQGYKYQFGILATSEQYLTPLVDLAADLAKKAGKDPSQVKVAMIYQDDAFSLDVRQGVVEELKKLKMQTVLDDRMPKDLNDISSFLTKVKALKPDVLFISGHEKGAATATRQMEERKIDVPLIGVTHCESAFIERDFPKAAEGLVCPTQWDETMKASDPMFGTAMDFNNQFLAVHPEYKGVVPYQVAQASAAIYVWKDAFERAQSLDTEKVREALTKTNLKTFYGDIKFAPDGTNPSKEMALRQIQAGKYKVVYPSEIAAAALAYPREAKF